MVEVSVQSRKDHKEPRNNANFVTGLFESRVSVGEEVKDTHATGTGGESETGTFSDHKAAILVESCCTIGKTRQGGGDKSCQELDEDCLCAGIDLTQEASVLHNFIQAGAASGIEPS
ncbi:MAG: hypothetical protein P8N76_04655 [Pirellulaceae bacterium]|nr:hypothetical protein [Pirellulaceae bacterium]